MKLLVSIIPGIGIACSLFLFLICVTQISIYKKTQYQRSIMIACFSFFAGLFSLEQFFVQSRLFHPEFVHYYIMFSSISVCLSYYFYFRSLSFFVAIPKWIYKICLGLLLSLAFLAFLGLPSRLVLDWNLYFDPSRLFENKNYFINSYTSRIGAPVAYISWILTISSCVMSFGALILLKIVMKSSRDVFFIIGLILSVLASLVENMPLPFTFDYFVPLIFVSNLFEAFRMNNLTLEEYFIEMNEKEEVQVPKEESSKEKYQNSNLSEDRLESLAISVTNVLKNEMLFKHPNLNSAELARKVGIPTYQLSQVINIGLNTTFFELISYYRIEYVKTLLSQEDQDKKIIELAYEAGFNSKSAFNTAFKKQTGMTPSRFKKQNILNS